MFRDLISDLRFRLRAAFQRGDVERELSEDSGFTSKSKRTGWSARDLFRESPADPIIYVTRSE